MKIFRRVLRARTGEKRARHLSYGRKEPGTFSPGQTMIEYLLSTVMILTLFTMMYAFLFRETRKLFEAAARMMLRAYY